VVLRRYVAYPLPALMDIGPAAAASKHSTAPINHIRPSPSKHSPDVTTPSEMAEPVYCLLLIYRPEKDKKLSWPGWLDCSGWFTHLSSHPLAAGWAQDSESTPAKDWHSTTEPRNGGAMMSAIHCWPPSFCCARPRGLELLARWPPGTAIWVL